MKKTNINPIVDALLQKGLLSVKEIEEISAKAVGNKDDMVSLIERAGIISEEEMIKVKGEVYNIPVID